MAVTGDDLEILKAQVEAIRDEANNLRRVLTDKANACMQCFTAAGAVPTSDPDEAIRNILTRRRENLADFDEAFLEYRKMLDELEGSYTELSEVKAKIG
jgi:DNA repair ATPase RecN